MNPMLTWLLVGFVSGIYCIVITCRNKKYYGWDEIVVLLAMTIIGFLGAGIAAIITLLMIGDYCSRNQIFIKNPFYKG